MNTDQVCDPECFTQACGWDSPACDQCDLYVSEETGIYADLLAASAEGEAGGADPPVLLYVVVILTLVMFILRVRTSILSALEGFDDPFGATLAKPWTQNQMAEVERIQQAGRGVMLGNKSMLNFYMAPVWPIPRAAPLQDQPDSQWAKDETDRDEIGRASLQYRDTASQYSSEDGQCIRLELHQAQTAAVSTILAMIFLFSSPLIGVVAGAKPGLAGAPRLSTCNSPFPFPYHFHVLLDRPRPRPRPLPLLRRAQHK